MRYGAVAVAAALMFALVAPAFAQPFADVPTNHWAYDAIAELAAKGLVEGYPDGTFKGDRAMTRYEMAMVVARLLARIESIQIPAPAPAPQVTAADLQAIQRLINEFRAELAALGVRVTAIEEELNAIKAKLDNVRITGRYRFRYDGSSPNPGFVSGGTANGNQNTVANNAGSPIVFRARQGAKLMIDGSVAPDVHAIIGLELGTGATSTPATFGGAFYGEGSTAIGGCNGGTPCYELANLGELYFDWNHAWGLPMRIQIGRMGGIINGFGMLPLQFGPFGLLLNTTSDTYGASNGNTGTALWDGLRISGNVPAWADLNYQAAVWRVIGGTGGGSYFLGEDVYGVDANIRLIPGLRIGGYFVSNYINAAGPAPSNAISALWHVYGNPNTPLTNPPTAQCPAVGNGVLLGASGGGVSQGGIQCPAVGNGEGFYVTWAAVPGLQLSGEYGSWNAGAANGTTAATDNAWMVGASVDIGAMTGIGHKFTGSVTYESAGANFYAPYQSDVDSDISGTVGPGNATALTFDLSFDINDQWNVNGAYITGNTVSNGMGYNEWRVGVTYRFAPGASLYTRYETQNINGIGQYTLYRTEMNYNF